MSGVVGTVLQTGYMLGVIAPLPTIEDLRADTKIAAGKPGIVPRAVVVIKPFKSLPGFSIAPGALLGERFQELLHLSI